MVNIDSATPINYSEFAGFLPNEMQPPPADDEMERSWTIAKVNRIKFSVNLNRNAGEPTNRHGSYPAMFN